MYNVKSLGWKNCNVFYISRLLLNFFCLLLFIYSFSMSCGITLFYWVVLTHICLIDLVCHKYECVGVQKRARECMSLD